jgi:transcription elongation factor Elf1
MAERVLKGSRLGATSYETDRNTDLAPRHEVTFDCPRGHTFTVLLAADAETPATWECKVCGTAADARDGTIAEPAKVKHVRTHWDMLLERRSLDELEAVLAERLAELHSRRPTRPARQRKSA